MFIHNNPYDCLGIDILEYLIVYLYSRTVVFDFVLRQSGPSLLRTIFRNIKTNTLAAGSLKLFPMD